jgi:hypothetical protein
LPQAKKSWTWRPARANLRGTRTSEVRERVLKLRIAAPLSFEKFWELRSETSATLREKLQTLSPTDLSHLKNDVQQAARQFFGSEGMSFPAQMIVVAGKKPAA